MKIGKYNIIIDWRNGYFWITVIIYLIISTVLAGLTGLWVSAALSLIPIAVYLIFPLFGDYMGIMGGALIRPNYPTPSWLIRFFAWVVLVGFMIMTFYQFIKYPLH